MFGIVARIVSSVAAFLFPIFASYKALKANDQTQLTPWLMYWVVIACVIVVDNFFGWFFFPFYQEIKAIFLLWLVLPQTKGATYLYLTYVHPYIQAHEAEIEELISSGHDQLKSLGMTYLRHLWAYLQDLMGVPPQDQTRPPSPPQPQPTTSYAQALLQKFSLPPIGPSLDPAAHFITSILSTFSGTATVTDIAVPPSMVDSFVLPTLPREEKLGYIEAQKRKLVEYIKFLDHAAAQHHNEDLTNRPTSASVSPYLESTSPSGAGSPPRTPRSRNLAGSFVASPRVPPDDEFEAVDRDDLPSGSVIVSGVKTAEETTHRASWFSGWGYTAPTSSH